MVVNRRTLIALAISLAFLALVFWSIDFDEFIDAFAEANYLWLIPAVIVYFLAFTLRAWRWQSLLAHLGRRDAGAVVLRGDNRLCGEQRLTASVRRVRAGVPAAPQPRIRYDGQPGDHLPWSASLTG